MVQVARLRAIAVRRAVVAPARDAEALDVAGEAVDQVVADEQVEPAVAVVVEERRRDAPAARVADAGGFRHVGERAVAVVAEKHGARESRAIQVHEAVVVEVARRDAHAIRPQANPALGSDIREPDRVRAVGVRDGIVSEQSVASPLGRPVGSQQVPLRDVDVEVAVVVVVEEADARRHDLRVVEAARHAVDVREVEAGRLGDVRKPLRSRGRYRALRRCRATGEPKQKSQNPERPNRHECQL